MQLPDHVTAQTLKKFALSKSPLYSGIVDQYWIQAPLSDVRADYALFHCLFVTNYFRSSKGANDFGGGAAIDMASGVELAVKKLSELKGDLLQLPVKEYEGMKHVESEFLRFVGVKPDAPAPLPLPVPAEPPPRKEQPIPRPVPTPGAPKVEIPPTPQPPSNGGFWAFIRSLAGFLGAINAVLFFAQMWIPAPVMTVIRVVIKLIADLAAANPATAVAVAVSSVVATHAMALKTAVPVKWREGRSAL